MNNCRAFIEVPDGAAAVLELLDNGVFADTTSDDGIYSRYFTAPMAAGRYALKCEVWSEGSAYSNAIRAGHHLAERSVMTRASPVEWASRAAAKVTGTFSRMADGGSFRVFMTQFCVQIFHYGLNMEHGVL